MRFGQGSVDENAGAGQTLGTHALQAVLHLYLPLTSLSLTPLLSSQDFDLQRLGDRLGKDAMRKSRKEKGALLLCAEELDRTVGQLEAVESPPARFNS